MFRLAHLSDVHLPPLPPAGIGELASKRILGYANWHLGRKLVYSRGVLELLCSHLAKSNCDHLAVTGDLVNISLKQEFANARAFLEQLGPPDRVTAICGNHDAYVPGSLKRAIRAWQPYLDGDDTVIKRGASWPVLRRRGNIAIIACNSALATGPFMATGRFGRKQFRKLRALLSETGEMGLFRVVLIHHSPVKGSTHWHKRLVGLGRFQRAIREAGAELVLHGHTHFDTRELIDGPVGPVPVICAPAASNMESGIKPTAAYNLFEISGEPGNWTVRQEIYGLSEAGDGIVFRGAYDLPDQLLSHPAAVSRYPNQSRAASAAAPATIPNTNQPNTDKPE